MRWMKVEIGRWLTRLFLGFVPMIGYHHMLMVIIAVAIILLCKCNLYFGRMLMGPD